jgi:hypothetical protein
MPYALDRPGSICSAAEDNLEALKAAGYYFMKGARQIKSYLFSDCLYFAEYGLLPKRGREFV